jgi:hypothetical protein
LKSSRHALAFEIRIPPGLAFDDKLYAQHSVVMLRTQIQLPKPLFAQLKRIARSKDWSLAELIRRGMESYAESFAESAGEKKWQMPVLRRSGGLLVDPASVNVESDVIASKGTRKSKFK